MGAYCTDELVNIKTRYLVEHGKMFLVTISTSKTFVKHSFTISDEYYLIADKYRKLRPANMGSNRFLVQYHNGKCSSQVIGKNKFSHTPTDIVAYFNLDQL